MAAPTTGQAAISGGKELFERYNVNSVPYGQAAEDTAHRRPFNTVDETVVVRVRNLSGLRPRRVEIDHISFYRGGERWAAEQLEKGRQVNLDMLYAQIAKFGDSARNVQPTEMQVAPLDAILTWNGKPWIVPFQDDHGKLAPWCEVPEGVMDLYYGNWKRLHEMSPKERTTELESVRARRRDFIVRRPVDADFMKEAPKTADRDNEFAFIVFDRKVVEPLSIAIDLERVYSGHAMEV